jgi:putative ATPase
LASPGAQLRLLFTNPGLGPAAALLSLPDLPTGLRQLLAPLPALEQASLEEPATVNALDTLLQARGWQLQRQRWQEPLQLTLTAALIERWLGVEAPYRRMLQAALSAKQMAQLHSELQALIGLRLPQQLQHQLLQGRRLSG